MDIARQLATCIAGVSEMPAQSQTQEAIERRAAPRFAVSLQARISSETKQDRDTAVLVEASVVNLSSGGLLVRGDPVDAPGALVRLSLRVPISGKAVHLDGRVVRVTPEGTAVELRGEPMEDWRLRQLTSPLPRGRR